MADQAVQQRPTILSSDQMKRAVLDDRFYLLLPEFLPIKRKMEAMHLDSARCKPCQKRRAVMSVSSDFVSILNSLSADGLMRLKKYLGVPRLIVRVINTNTHRVESREV